MAFEIRPRLRYIAQYIIYINENFSAVTLASGSSQEDDAGMPYLLIEKQRRSRNCATYARSPNFIFINSYSFREKRKKRFPFSLFFNFQPPITAKLLELSRNGKIEDNRNTKLYKMA
ncbi:hypothetical protein TcasGA2_TC009244 [Tribolium castaneum]|uniref:Uncharacterized protein n=1 Tax=Tribolium castaneum TaxID=7070 RepID=D6WSH2_TRICA|nr:hypothetical protein TcasGA2_TC009244 [Tribolium castaneum]